MSRALRLTLVRLGCLLAVLLSGALLQDYLEPSSSALCGAGSGCAAVRELAPRPFGLPHFVPLVGVLAYAVVFWLSFVPGQRLALRATAAAGGVLGATLLGHQALILGAWCWLCVLVDLLAIGIALASWQLGGARVREPFRGWGWAGLFALAINAPVLWQRLEPRPSLPAPIEQLRQRGTLDVIQFVDFQCPHCRALHTALAGALRDAPLPVRRQVYHVPLSIHPLAEDAARASICASALGQGEAMIDRLLERPLLPEVWIRHAGELDLDLQRFESCLSSERTTAILDRHRRLYRATGAHGLPLTFIGDEVLNGAVSTATLRAALERAASRARLKVPGWLFAAAVLTLAASWLWLARSPNAAQRARAPDSDG